ncbi:MAG: hypothetical protein V3W04_02310 [Gammaproteobacteria bacterium]
MQQALRDGNATVRAQLNADGGLTIATTSAGRSEVYDASSTHNTGDNTTAGVSANNATAANAATSGTPYDNAERYAGAALESDSEALNGGADTAEAMNAALLNYQSNALMAAGQSASSSQGSTNVDSATLKGGVV